MREAAPELIVDSFAGGGGTSEGIRAAIGRDPDIAINHDALALAMHRVNHPDTRHMVENVWHVDARRMCDGRPIGLLWMSPDCKHFSKAKGGKPREKGIRGLAWVGLQWVKSLPKPQRPRVIILENVKEFQDWGPLLVDGLPCPIQKGATFKRFVEGFRQLGYVVEWRELRACDYGDPTIRERLFVIMRRDGKPIVWPERTHGNPKRPDDAKLIAAGVLKPWRTAAEILDFSLPCPSIFDTSEEIKEKLGLRAIRPLAENTMSRVAKGTMRYVVNAAKPFIVKVNHSGSADVARDQPVDAPLATQTAKRDDALVMPFVTKFNSGSIGHAVDEPLATVTSHASETHGGGAAPLGLVAPILVNTANGKTTGRGPNTWPADEPSRTITSAGGQAVVAPILVGCGGRAGQSEPRTADEPVLTQTAKPDACVAAVHLSTMRNSGKPFSAADDPTQTMTAGGANAAVVAAFLGRQFGASIGGEVDAPAPTVTAGGAGKTAVVAAFMAQHTAGSHPAQPAKPLDEPLSTITAKGCQQGLVATHMVNLRGSERRGAATDEPLQTVSAQGNHAGLVAAFLAKYYGAGEPSQAADEPLHTVTAKPRHGLVVVTIDGENFVITDIGMRMLTPRERFSAQGFRPDYVIDYGLLEDGTRVALSLEQQGRMCGNSVCPGMAKALVGANYDPADAAPFKQRASSAPLLEAAE